MTYTDIINQCNKVFMQSLNKGSLLRAEEELLDLSKKGNLSEQNKRLCEGVYFKLKLKRLAIVYFNEGFCTVDYDSLHTFATEKKAIAEERKYPKTTLLLATVDDVATRYHAVLNDVSAEADRVRDSEWNVTTTSVAVCDEVAKIFDRKIKAIENIEVSENLFGDNVNFYDIKEETKKVLLEVRDFAVDAAEKMRKKSEEKFVSERAKRMKEASAYRKYDYFLSVDAAKKGVANTTVLCTPIEEEAKFFAAYNTTGELYELEANAFVGKKEKHIQNIFSVFGAENKDIVLYGLENYHGENKDLILSGAINLGRSGRRVFLVDLSGRRKIYDDMVSLLKVGESTLDISYRYLAMPYYSDLIDVFSKEGMIDGEDAIEKAYVMNNMPFLGFVGLNLAVLDYKAGRDWRKNAIDLSSYNKSLVSEYKYFDNIPSQKLFIDSGWGKFTQDRIWGKKREFNYDNVREVDRRNVGTIMAAHISLFAKCGCVVNYCLTAGADKSEWKLLTEEERQNRVTQATYMLYQVLNINYTPKVEFVNSFADSGTAGMCCHGGKLIQYKKSFVNSDRVGDILIIICHETMHAFQHKIMDEGVYCDWYFEELGITEGRIEELRYNNLHYMQPGEKGFEVYMVQVMESDARTFATDCSESIKKVWHIFDFS